jgi:hypothetical protein
LNTSIPQRTEFCILPEILSMMEENVGLPRCQAASQLQISEREGEGVQS